MGDISPPTAADYANNAAQDNRMALDRLTKRIESIELGRVAPQVEKLMSDNAKLRSENESLLLELHVVREALREYAGGSPSPIDGEWREVSPSESDLKL